MADDTEPDLVNTLIANVLRVDWDALMAEGDTPFAAALQNYDRQQIRGTGESCFANFL